jgi:outer membrane lipoprotein-sorting protein
MAVQGEFYDTQEKLWKKMTASEIKEVDTGKHKWLAHNVRIENIRNGKFTVLKFTGVKVNMGIPDSTFTSQNLAREK